jgi:RNase P protein component
MASTVFSFFYFFLFPDMGKKVMWLLYISGRNFELFTVLCLKLSIEDSVTSRFSYRKKKSFHVSYEEWRKVSVFIGWNVPKKKKKTESVRDRALRLFRGGVSHISNQPTISHMSSIIFIYEKLDYIWMRNLKASKVECLRTTSSSSHFKELFIIFKIFM